MKLAQNEPPNIKYPNCDRGINAHQLRQEHQDPSDEERDCHPSDCPLPPDDVHEKSCGKAACQTSQRGKGANPASLNGCIEVVTILEAVCNVRQCRGGPGQHCSQGKCPETSWKNYFAISVQFDNLESLPTNAATACRSLPFLPFSFDISESEWLLEKEYIIQNVGQNSHIFTRTTKKIIYLSRCRY